jgi:hypothetical protein
LGAELREEGFALRPPAGFTLSPLDFFRGTRAGAVSAWGSGDGLVAVLVDGEGADAAALLIAQVDGSFDGRPAARDELSGAVVHHFQIQLGMPFSLESARAVPGAAPRIEVLGTLRQEGEVRHVLVAAMAGEGRHAVMTFSAPSGRYASLLPAIEASLDTFRAEPAGPSPLSRSAAGAVAGGIAGALVVSLALWRQRRRPPSSPG